NTDCQEWAEAWNLHNLQIRGEHTRSPRNMFLFSMVRDGPRGLEQSVEPPSEDVEDPGAYGIDWQATDDPQLMTHLLNENPEQSPFASGPPTHSHVLCEPPNSLFSPEQIALLKAVVDVTSPSMGVRRLVWTEAFRICNEFYAYNN
ncbi:hypothetical protein B0H16DRAFT_1329504, partial [Mycena metata]